MKLDALTRRDTERVVAVLRCEIVENTPLPGRHHPAWDAPADHHDELLLRLAQVPVVLLVNAVEFQKLHVILRKSIRLRVGQRLGNGAGERRGRFFDNLIMRHFQWRVRCNHKLIAKDTDFSNNVVRLST